MKAATTVEKVCRVLNAFSGRPSPCLTEVAENTGLLKSDAHRILKSLEMFGFIEQDRESRRYRLGLELLKLGHLVHARLHLSDTARPFLRALSEAAGGTANLAIFDPVDREIIFVEQIDCPSEVQIRWRIGHSAFPHATAVGKTILAHLDPETARAVVEKSGLSRKTRHTITSVAELERELHRVREAGYAVDREEGVEGACCIGAPVRSHTGCVVAAVSVSMMKVRLARLREAEVIALVKSAAGKISGALGYSPPAEVAAGKPRAAGRSASAVTTG